MNPNCTLTLKSGQIIGFADYGKPDGKPLLFFHGLPGSRLQAFAGHTEAEEAGVRLISVDRPGMGLSTYQPNRTIMDWPQTVNEFADKLGIDEFCLLAVSGGAPYALACAVTIPERLNKITICSGVPSHDWFRKIQSPKGVGRFIRRILTTPRLIRMVVLILARWYIRINRGRVNRRAAGKILPAVDAQIMTDTRYSKLMAMNVHEALRDSIKGVEREIELLISDWGFDPANIAFPVSIWYAGIDWIVPPDTEEALIAKLNCDEKRYYENEGHFSLPLKHIGELIRESSAFL